MKSLTLFVVADPRSRYLSLLQELPDDVNIFVGPDPEMFAERGPDAEVILVGIGMNREKIAPVFSLAPNVKWVHALAAGVDSLLFPALQESPVTLTNAAGVYGASLAEWSLGAMLFFAKNFRQLVRNQETRKWEDIGVSVLHGATLGLLGFGGIGRATARLAKAFGMKVVALRRRSGSETGNGPADMLLGPDQKAEFFHRCDYIVCSLPLTAETRRFVGETELRTMKNSAVFINVGRGAVVEETALVRALREEWIRGAAMDVFEVEPLPPGHPFYEMKNVLLSPHCADHTGAWREDTMRFFLENFHRYRTGRPLKNIVDKRAGY